MIRMMLIFAFQLLMEDGVLGETGRAVLQWLKPKPGLELAQTQLHWAWERHVLEIQQKLTCVQVHIFKQY